MKRLWKRFLDWLDDEPPPSRDPHYTAIKEALKSRSVRGL
jgi:hypothetical protein